MLQTIKLMNLKAYVQSNQRILIVAYNNSKPSKPSIVICRIEKIQIRLNPNYNSNCKFEGLHFVFESFSLGNKYMWYLNTTFWWREEARTFAINDWLPISKESVWGARNSFKRTRFVAFEFTELKNCKSTFFVLKTASGNLALQRCSLQIDLQLQKEVMNKIM